MRLDYIIQTITTSLIAGMLIFFVGCKTIDYVSENGGKYNLLIEYK